MKVSREKIISAKRHSQKICTSEASIASFAHPGKMGSIATTAASVRLNILNSLPSLARCSPHSLRSDDIEAEKATFGSLNSLKDVSEKTPKHRFSSSRSNVHQLSSMKSVKKVDPGTNESLPDERDTSLHGRMPFKETDTTNRPTQIIPQRSTRHSIPNTIKNFRIERLVEAKPKAFEERARDIKEQHEEFVQAGLGNQEMNQQLKMLYNHFRILSEKAYSRYIVEPDAEKEVMQGIVELENYTTRLLKAIKKALYKQNTMSNTLTSQYQSLQRENQKLTKDLETKIDETKTMRPMQPKRSIKDPAAPEMVWAVEKAQMSAQIDMLHEEISQLKLQQPVLDLPESILETESSEDPRLQTLEDEVDKKETKLFKMRGTLAMADARVKELHIQLQQSEDKFTELKTQYDTLQVNFDQVSDRENQYREIAFMSQQDLIQREKNYGVLLQHSKDLLRKCFESQYRLGRFKREDVDVNLLIFEDSDKDNTLFDLAKDVANVSITAKRPLLRTLLVDYEAPSSELDFEALNQNIKEPKNGSLEKLSLYKPTFYSLIQNEYLRLKEKIPTDADDGFYPFNRTYLSIVRGILDSKYNEFVYHDDYKQCSQFPEFVYGWLSSFDICPHKRTVKAIDAGNNFNAEERRVGFYKFLSDPRLDRTWDVVVFKDFLEERYSADEMFFYLHCRYILFQGGELNTLGGSFNVIDWVRYEECDRVARHIFPNMNDDEYGSLLVKLKEKAKRKNKVWIVNSALCLKTLLEVYKAQRKVKLNDLRRSFDALAKEGIGKDPRIGFIDFSHFITVNFSGISAVEKANLYRQAWCINNGSVNFKAFLIAANESNLFLGQTKAEMLLRTPFFTNNILWQESEAQREHVRALMESKISSFSQALLKVKESAGSLGIEPVLASINCLRTNFTSKFFGKEAYIDNQEIYMSFNRLMHLAGKIQRQYYFMNNNSVSDGLNLLESDIKTFDELLCPINYFETVSQGELQNKNNKARKIQSYYKKTKANWYGLLELLRPETAKKSADVQSQAIEVENLTQKA